MSRRIVVKKSVDLVMYHHSLSLIEHRFLNMCIGGIYYKDKITKYTDCAVSTDRYASEYNIKYKEALSQLKEIQISLIKKRVITLEVANLSIQWITKMEFNSNDEVYVKFHEKMIPYISSLKANFIKYDIGIIKNLKSTHSIRIYELLKTRAYDNAGWKLHVELDELKKMLVVANKYPQYGSFKRMLDVSLEEINEHTDIKATVKERKLGRKVVKLVFSMEKPVTSEPEEE
ncbi:MAG: replication initiation protein [Nitrosarchaeum sp.]|nr:replication initiation protein [Nitrosarchaeum sp.]MBS3922800.1 replication initiation protein [Nitrosarchaeum sp.]